MDLWMNIDMESLMPSCSEGSRSVSAKRAYGMSVRTSQIIANMDLKKYQTTYHQKPSIVFSTNPGQGDQWLTVPCYVDH